MIFPTLYTMLRPDRLEHLLGTYDEEHEIPLSPTMMRLYLIVARVLAHVQLRISGTRVWVPPQLMASSRRRVLRAVFYGE